MNLRTLRYFVAISDAGSLTAAAEALSVAQPALTRQMHDLERDLGVALLLRTSKGVHMTQAGAALYQSALRMLAEAQKIRTQLESPRATSGASVAMGASPTLSRVLVPGVFEKFQRTISGVKLSVREGFTPTLIDWVEKGLIDLALITGTGTETRKRISVQPLLGEPFALVTPRARHLGAVVAVSQLPRTPLLMTTLHRSIVERELLPLGIRLNVQSEIDSVDSIRALVLQGQWSTLMPISVFKELPPGHQLVLSEISGVQLNRQLFIATRIERDESATVGLLRDLVHAEVERLTRRGLFSFGTIRKRRA
jgi:LysR family nitrogen assimilation transcriptional regulator